MSVKASKKVKLGVIGCGYWGPNLIRNFLQVSGAKVVFACDKDKKRLNRMRALYPSISLTTNFEGILKEKIDAVVISTPASQHFQIAKKALKKGKHVLVEKPFVLSSKEAKELINLAKEKKKILMVDHTFEYTKAVERIKKMIAADELGRIYTVNMVRVNLGIFQKDYNVIWDLAYHDVSILLYLFKKLPTSVIAVGQDFIQGGVEDSAYVILKFPNKMLALLHISWLAPRKIRQVTFVGSKKMLIYDDLEATDKLVVLDKGVKISQKKLPKMAYYETFSEFISYAYKHGDSFIPRIENREPLLEVAEHFIESVSKNKKPKSSGEEGLRVVKVLEAMNESIRAGGEEVRI